MPLSLLLWLRKMLLMNYIRANQNNVSPNTSVNQGGYVLGAFYAFVQQRQEPKAHQQVVATLPEQIKRMGADSFRNPRWLFRKVVQQGRSE
jgi:hypothetical protein